MKINTQITQLLTNKILDSRKYRHSGLNPETIRDLIHQEAEKSYSEKQLLKAVRRKLHNIVAPYLGEPDYEELLPRLHALNDTSLESPTLRDLCLEVLSQHASTDERIPLLSKFYDRLFAVTGKPRVLCGAGCRKPISDAGRSGCVCLIGFRQAARPPVFLRVILTRKFYCAQGCAFQPGGLL